MSDRSAKSGRRWNGEHDASAESTPLGKRVARDDNRPEFDDTPPRHGTAASPGSQSATGRDQATADSDRAKDNEQAKESEQATSNEQTSGNTGSAQQSSSDRHSAMPQESGPHDSGPQDSRPQGAKPQGEVTQPDAAEQGQAPDAPEPDASEQRGPEQHTSEQGAAEQAGQGAPSDAPQPGFEAGIAPQPHTPGGRADEPAPGSPLANRRPKQRNDQPVDRRYEANELIDQLTPSRKRKSGRGWRARFGLKPSQKELDEQRDLSQAQTHFDEPVTIMVANPKGGVGKTPVSLMLAAAFGVARGGGVLAWDNNELRGTMPDRSESPHRRNVRDLLADIHILRQPASQFTDLAHFINHQPSGTFYTLGSAQSTGRMVSKLDFELVHEIFRRYFQVIVVDTGNNEAAPNWMAAAEVADCLVVPTKWRKDSLIPAARMLEGLQDVNPGLLRRTVIAATNGPSDSQPDVKSNGASWFGSSHPIVEVPTDPHIAEGGVIDYAKLEPQTQRATLRLAAEVARRMVEA